MSEHQGGGSGFPISAWAIRNPVPVTLLFIGLLVAGMIAYSGLAVKQFPNIQFPVVAVTVTQSGAAPGEMETQITRPVEDAMSGITGVKNIQSVVTQGVSTTSIQFEMGEDLQKKTDEVRAKVDQTRQILPRDIDEPTVTRVEIDDAFPIITYAVEAPSMSDEQLSWYVDDKIARDLQTVSGVAQITRVGGVAREINVVVDPDRLAARGLTAAEVNNALMAFQQDAPGGRVQVGGREQTIRVLGSAETVAQLRAMTIATGGGGFVRLTDVADVGEGSAEARGFARLNNRPVVGFQVSKTKESSDVDVEDGVNVKLAEIAKADPSVKFTKIYASVDETRANFRATQHVLLEGMVLAALVVLLFLRDWRATAITVLAMPISLIPTFFVMKLAGFSLNLVTLLALTLVIGILVDDAIVEIENIEKRVARGVRPFKAALEGADAIGLAVVATTFAIVVVFTPVSFMPGIPGQFFKEFGLTVSVAVLFSLLVARLATPLMAAYFLKPTVHERPQKPFEGFYPSALKWALEHRILASIAGLVLFACSAMMIGFLPKGFQPPGDPDYVYINVQGAPGATIGDMERAVQQATQVMAAQPEVTGVFSQVGSTVANFGPGGGGGGSDLRNGTITVLLSGDRKVTGNELKDRVRAQIAAVPDVRLNFLDGQGSAGFEQILISSDPKALEQAALELERQMRTLTKVTDPRPKNPPIGPELVIRPRPDEAARLGVSVAAIAQAARVATVGDIDANIPKMNEGERRIPIRIRLPESARADIEQIRQLRLPTASGGSTTLGAVADVEFQAGPARIDRLNRQRQMTVQAELADGVELGDATQVVHQLPIMKKLPPGVAPSAIGDAEAMAEMFGGFVVAFATAVFLMFAVLVLLFRSFFKPIVILAALPLAVGGAFIGLFIFNLSLSIPSLIGFLMLMGLAAKNSILLVEYAIEREREGMPQRDALIEACRERARPIVMTTVAMAAGMLPTALALEKGAEFRQPMAVAVIGGLITSTLLSLVLVPVVYEFVDDFENWLRPKLAKLITPREAPGETVPEDRV
ncbi:efflux RND transporter permease subunit [Phenylobacterium sp. NIBR 498073]|uniref:efflux RND transporter permease subunit n=1 Tax=Phenylobacterium sp. NIBR 498073 TaxID=3015177 RepID=UPI0022B354AC|nr:efflux RND transporter permease subunit [Phenylobacterium sp. NIBR 498073]WGU40822.1 efflux RND transporter permease subunit [Phenylobacterium sp. NIBR 498073]